MAGLAGQENSLSQYVEMVQQHPKGHLGHSSTLPFAIQDGPLSFCSMIYIDLPSDFFFPRYFPMFPSNLWLIYFTRVSTGSFPTVSTHEKTHQPPGRQSPAATGGSLRDRPGDGSEASWAHGSRSGEFLEGLEEFGDDFGGWPMDIWFIDGLYMVSIWIIYGL